MFLGWLQLFSFWPIFIIITFIIVSMVTFPPKNIFMIHRFFLSDEKYQVAFYVFQIRIILFMYDIASGEESLVVTHYVILRLNISMNV